MAQKAAAISVKKNAAKSNGHNLDGREVQNKILLSLTGDECSAVFAKLEFVMLPVPTVLNEVGEQIKFAYFMNDGLASVLNIMADGKSVEVGLCGKEGFVGLPLAAGFSSSPTRVIVQVAGSAFRITAKDLVAALHGCPTLACWHTAIRARVGAAIVTGGGMQPSARSRRAPRAMAADVARQIGRRHCAADAGISGAHAGHAQSKRHGSRRNFAARRINHLLARLGED